jgi:3-hydroxyisobutyrate dehydrogenase-like beta-hydroxyacid dehydrogenase
MDIQFCDAKGTVMKSTIGFIGLGEMGRHMAGHLLKNDFPVVSCANRSREAIEALKLDGLQEVDNPRLVGEHSDILMIVVVDQDQTDQVLRGDDGALVAMRQGSTVVVMSTLAPGYCQELAEDAASVGVRVLDCPISGGPMGAENGTLALITGGEEKVVEDCRAALESMGSVYHCGDVGMGMVAKLANNAVGIGASALLIEVRTMANAYGMDLPTLMEIIRNGTGNCFAAQNWDAVVPTWPHLAQLMKKDMNLCRDAGKQVDVGLPMIETWLETDWISMKPEDL